MISILGAVLTVVGVLLALAAGISSDSGAMERQSKIFSPLLTFGIPTLLVGLVLYNINKTRERRGELNNEPSHAATSKPDLRNIVIACLAIMLSPSLFVGLPLSVYVYFKNPVGTLSRILGLVGVLISLGFGGYQFFS